MCSMAPTMSISPGGMASIISGVFLYAFPSWRFRSTWMGIIVHSAQSVYFSFLISSYWVWHRMAKQRSQYRWLLKCRTTGSLALIKRRLFDTAGDGSGAQPGGVDMRFEAGGGEWRGRGRDRGPG